MNRRNKRDLKRMLKILPLLVIATWLVMAIFDWIPKLVDRIRRKHAEIYNRAIDERMIKLREELESDNF